MIKRKKRERELLGNCPMLWKFCLFCSEAGLSLEQALDQYLRNAKSGALKEEFSKIMEQTRSGSGRKIAFTSVTEKLNLTDFFIIYHECYPTKRPNVLEPEFQKHSSSYRLRSGD